MVGIVLYVAIVFGPVALGQDSTPRHEDSAPTIRLISTLVMVPTFVRSPSGEAVTDLHACDFRLATTVLSRKYLLSGQRVNPLP